MRKQKVKPLHVYILLDATASMFMCRNSTISAINEYVDSLKDRAHGESIYLTLRQFNSFGVEDIYKNRHINSVEHLTLNTYVCKGITPLYDSIANLIDAVERVRTRNDRVLFIIMTDGEENASRVHTKQGVKEMIQSHQNGCVECGGNKWTFVFLGCDQDAWIEGGKIGTISKNTFTYQKGRELPLWQYLSVQTDKLYKSGEISSQCMMAEFSPEGDNNAR